MKAEWQCKTREGIVRFRPVYAVLIVVVMTLGLSSRSRFALELPAFIATYSGDTLWSLMVFLILGFIFTKLRTLVLVAGAVLISFMIEFSQLYQADWINQIRSTRLGALILGSGFLWSDLVCYGVGAMMGGAGEVLFDWIRKVRVKRQGSPG